MTMRCRHVVLSVVLFATTVRAAPVELVEIPVAFTIVNSNSSKVPCLPDGQAYIVTGRITAPKSVLESSSRSITVYLHGAIIGQAGYAFPVPGYDHVRALGDLGHASLVFDRIGYGSADVPNGLEICAGSDADTVHQIIMQLRSGTYSCSGDGAPSFDRIALAGFSVGGLIAEIEAYSYQDIDALIVHEWADDPAIVDNPDLMVAAAELGLTCAHGGDGKREGAPAGYAYLGSDPESLYFFDPEAAVVTKFRELRERDPCGTEGSAYAIAFDLLYLDSVRVPVLLIYGEHGFFRAPTGHRQASRFTGSSDVSLAYVLRAGHAIMLEKQAPRDRFRAVIADWLSARGF